MPHLGLFLIVAVVAAAVVLAWRARARKRVKQRAARHARREELDRQWRERTGQRVPNGREP